jgi:hypothetical protein
MKNRRSEIEDNRGFHSFEIQNLRKLAAQEDDMVEEVILLLLFEVK